MNKENAKIIFTIGGLIFVAGIVLFLFTPIKKADNPTVVSSNGSLATQKQYYDFKDVSMQKGKVAHDFILKNTSSEPVIIGEVTTSCMCTTVMILQNDKKFGPFGMLGHSYSPSTNVEIMPNQEIVVQAIFDPAAHGPAGFGINERQISIKTNSIKTPIVSFNFKANVIP